MNRKKQVIVVIAVLLACVSFDQATKAVARERLPRHEVMSFLGDVFRVQYAENRGAFLGMGAALPERTRTIVFVTGIGAVVAGILTYVLLAPVSSVLVTAALSLIAAGGLGNLVDRVVLGGYVVDFLNIGIGPVRTGIFNIADVAISAGALLLIFEQVVRSKKS
jgi:signal peptidase II